MRKHKLLRSTNELLYPISAPPQDERKRNQVESVTEEKPKEIEIFLSWYKHHLRNLFQAFKFHKERKGTSVVNPDDCDCDDETESDDALERKKIVKEEQTITLPEISDPSLLLTDQARRSLYPSLPALLQGRKWVLLYSTWRHGITLSTLYRKSQLWPGLSLLVVGDKKGSVFGGLVEAPLAPTNNKYQGTDNTFVFTDNSGSGLPTVYRSTGANRFYTLCSKDFLALGGGGRFALYLDSELLHGSSACSDTFGNSCLANSQDFDVKHVELWGFVNASMYDEILSLSRRTETICRWA
ncbi:unnamed protein product [Eruca vesicaria subsp. sativa]|uniref:TLDc domain-containing protein n=1 Tax=Eruca vesicaria subsp. sativa TaxID=29727 RepID=A0ABC8JWB2_ERUVS|nr:unnamed protein product [Eruca vesicaria subsp. sativa]